MLEKPQEEIVLRPITEGGLGLLDVELRAKAFLIGSFLQTSINPKFNRNIFHETLFKCYVNEEVLEQKPTVPSYFGGNFFEVIRDLKMFMH